MKGEWGGSGVKAREERGRERKEVEEKKIKGRNRKRR